MILKYDRQITISVGSSRKSITWNPLNLSVSQLYEKLMTPVRGAKTIAQYMKLSKSQQDDLKDIGGFVGGTLSGSRRKENAVLGRDVVTLDFDNINLTLSEFLSKVEEIGVNACVYSTRKHRAEAPRLRVVIPLSRTVSADEYCPVSRRLAESIGIAMADPSTFEASRLMYWPSCCLDTEYVFETYDNPICDADIILSSYNDWKDYSEWPEVPGEEKHQKVLAAKQGDPEEKSGIIGAFCRRYDIHAAIETFIPGIYIRCDDADRYTYVNGSTTGGAVVYDNGKFLYSHHATDPCSGKLVNSFDLVRYHKFGDLDDGAAIGTPTAKLPSYIAMMEFAAKDAGIAADMLRERANSAVNDFADLERKNADSDNDDNKKDSGKEREPWMDGLEYDHKGLLIPTIQNLFVILVNDSRIAGKIGLNLFSGRNEVIGKLPWDPGYNKPRLWSDTDMNGMYYFMETFYKVTKRQSVDSAVSLYMTANAFDDVEKYLDSLEWDGKGRLDSFFIDYLGAKDTEYVRAVTRKIFTAAVKRVYEPGCKFDCMLVLVGPQGIGKSRIIKKMARDDWFLDSITTFEGKEAAEQMRGKWLIEIAELDAMRKSDISRVKQFLSSQVDVYRAAYGHNTSEYPRRSVFFGTTNYEHFMSDVTGNRRFWPVDCAIAYGKDETKRRIDENLTDNEINQIWAEAKMRYVLGENLYLDGDTDEAAVNEQRSHLEESVTVGLINDFVERKVPKDFDSYSKERRRGYWINEFETNNKDDKDLVYREKICAIEVLYELLGVDLKDIDKYDKRKRDINAVLENNPHCIKIPKSYYFGKAYASQRGYLCDFSAEK